MRGAALAILLALALAGCGKYGPPVRTPEKTAPPSRIATPDIEAPLEELRTPDEDRKELNK